MEILPSIKSYDEQAIDVVVTIINAARFRLGERPNLMQLAQTRDFIVNKYKVSLVTLKPPFSKTTLPLIANAIQNIWKLTPTLKYVLKYVQSSRDDTNEYYYFEAVFSQPQPASPIPQATASVFFRLDDRLLQSRIAEELPKLYFRVEGQHHSHDVRFVNLSVDWILATLQMKCKLYQRIEQLRIF